MELSTIEISTEQAEEAFKEYRSAVRSTAKEKYAAARRDYETIDRAVMRGYKEIAKGHRLLRLSETIAAGGTQELEWQADYWHDGRWFQRTARGTFPRLAVCRADARHVMCSGLRSDGGVTFFADGRQRQADTVRLEQAFGSRPEGQAMQEHRAIVPTIPPPFRPQHKLSGYHLLWEAEWDLTAPADPALLKHLGGDLYAVLAVWDLTELEQAVLGGIRA